MKGLKTILAATAAVASVAAMRKVSAMAKKISEQLGEFYTRLDGVTNKIADTVREGAGRIEALSAENASLKAQLGQQAAEDSASTDLIDRMNLDAEKLEGIGSDPQTPIPPDAGEQPQPGPSVDEPTTPANPAGTGDSNAGGATPATTQAAAPNGAVLDADGKLAEDQTPNAGKNRPGNPPV